MGSDFLSQGELKNNRAKILAIIFLITIFSVLIYLLNEVVNKNVNLFNMALIVVLVIILIPLSLFVADTFLYEGE